MAAPGGKEAWVREQSRENKLACQRVLARWTLRLMTRHGAQRVGVNFGRWRQITTRAALARVQPAAPSRRPLGRMFSACVRQHLLVLAKGFWRWATVARCLTVRERAQQQTEELQSEVEATASRECMAGALLCYRAMRNIRAKHIHNAFQRWWRLFCVESTVAATTQAAAPIAKGAAAVGAVLRATWAKKQAFRLVHGFSRWRRFAFPPSGKQSMAPEWLVWPVRCWSIVTASIRQRESLREEISKHLIATNSTLRNWVVRSVVLRWGTNAKRKAFRYWHCRTVPMIRARFSVRS